MTRPFPELRPESEFDRSLLDHVHPSDWTNPEPCDRYNLVVLGAGSAGLVTAAGAAGVGAKVAIVEAGLMGGDCLNVGCVPSKALLRSAHAVSDLRRSQRLGIRIDGPVRVDFAAVMERMRSVRASIAPLDSARRFRDELGVDVFLGRGQFTGAGTLQVGDQRLHFKNAVVATGGRPMVPPVPGLSEAGYYTNETIFALNEPPKHLLVLGGGPIGCELAQAFQRLGCQVTIVEMLDQFLPREDPDAAAILHRALEEDGIQIRLGTQITRVEGSGREKRVFLESGGRGDELSVDSLLVGAGRAPNVEGLGLEAVGVDFDPRTGIRVNDRFQTSNPRIYAAGDVCMQHKFTHAADAAARAVVRNALFFGREKLSALTIPWCTYTDPEIAHVGLYPKDAATRGIEINSFQREFSDVDRAVAEGNPVGFVKIHVERGSDRIVGATIVGNRAGDLISEISVAMAAGMGLSRLAAVIHPYPTEADAIRQCGDAYNRTRLTPRLKKFFERYLAFIR
jgi:pyruvate/2-oxoglutarate dehydrogenase complex dihydrolipoamide dehydrogenase (E3) component